MLGAEHRGASKGDALARPGTLAAAAGMEGARGREWMVGSGSGLAKAKGERGEELEVKEWKGEEVDEDEGEAEKGLTAEEQARELELSGEVEEALIGAPNGVAKAE
mmetsp:Transcript_13539/g.23921  ORF Transcript_13539/g.23921 Transcript_13539/m.23921 type:complete len:106 (-) Transcript_13539:1254-1571(-)